MRKNSIFQINFNFDISGIRYRCQGLLSIHVFIAENCCGGLRFSMNKRRHRNYKSVTFLRNSSWLLKANFHWRTYDGIVLASSAHFLSDLNIKLATLFFAVSFRFLMLQIFKRIIFLSEIEKFIFSIIYTIYRLPLLYYCR